MRLTPIERRAIVEEIQRKVPAAAVYLYGSRVHEHLKGGDIDLLVLCEGIAFGNEVDMLLAIKRRIGDQKVDLTVASPGHAHQDPFLQSILPEALRLDDSSAHWSQRTSEHPV